MTMNTTLPKLKKKIMTISGAKLDKSYPYWMRSNQIKLIEGGLQAVIELGDENPSTQFTPTEKQRVKLEDWIDNLKHSYL